MAHVLGVLIAVGLVFIAAFFQLSAVVWTILIGVGLVVLSLAGLLAPLAMTVFFVIFVVAALFANLTVLRQRYIVAPALNALRKQMPTISTTEREAIEAGDTWWEKELFCGRPDWEKLYSIPKPTLSLEEEAFLNTQVEHLCGMLNDWEITREKHDLPQAVWDYLKQEKFLGMVIGKEYGGLGFSALAHSTIVLKIASRSLSTAVNTMVPNSLGPGELLHRYGTTEQKDYYLPRLARGEDIPCFALTGPDAGSDAGSISDTGIVCQGEYQGKQVLGIRLSWDKRYITLAPIATVLGLAIHLYDPDHLLGKKEDVGITLCLIPTSHPGVEIGHRHFPMYLAFMNGPTRGKDVFIPLDWIIGGVDMAGQGWRMLMECLSIGRSISLPALATACTKVTYRYTGAYARIRKQFNTPISAFEGVEEALGHIAGNAYMLEATRVMTAGAVDQHINPAIVSAIAKYHMTEASRVVVDHAMDVHSGHMIQTGPRNILANAYMALPISITVEGANILTRNLIIFGQGAIRCHPYILKEVELITAEKPDVAALDRTLMSHIGFFIGNALRSFAYGLTGGHFIIVSGKNARIKGLKKQLTRMSAALALLADASLILLGGSLKRRERISARLGDIMSQLYLASATLKFYHDSGKPSSDIDYVCWVLQTCLAKIQIACDELADNFPQKWIGKLLLWVVFPWGRAYQQPNDKLHSKIIEAMTAPSVLRDRLTKYCYQPTDANSLGARLDKALTQVAIIDPIMKKIQKAVQEKTIARHLDFAARVQAALQLNVITAEEAEVVIAYEALRTEIVKVNEFSFDLKEVIA